jgi:hypothetical protein
MRWFFLWFIIVGLTFGVFSTEKIIQVPQQMTVEMMLANSEGLYNGRYNIRLRLFDTYTKERLWYQDYTEYLIEDGAFVLVLDTSDMDPDDLSRDQLRLVVSIDDDPVEIPLLTDIYAYRSLVSEYGYATRFPMVLFIDETKKRIGMGTDQPQAALHVNGAIKVGAAVTDTVGAIRWSASSLYVKHADAWVDLLHAPTSFEVSRWSALGDGIALSNTDYKVGVGARSPLATLHIEKDGYISEDLYVNTAKVSRMSSAHFDWSPNQVTATEIRIVNASDDTRWSPSSLHIGTGTISGDGSALTNIGGASFGSSVLTSNHFDTGSVASRNILAGAIHAQHLANNSVDGDAFSSSLFTEKDIVSGAIQSHHIEDDSLLVTVLNGSLNETIGEGFFSSNIVASNSVFTQHLQDQTITSVNLTDDSIGKDHIEDDLILGNHVAPNQIIPGKIAAGAITPALFSGVALIEDGGTGQSHVTPNRVIRMGDSAVDSGTIMYLDEDHRIGIYDETTMPPSQQTFLHALEVGSVDTSASIQLKSVGTHPLTVTMKNTLATANLQLTDAGQWALWVNEPTHGYGIQKTALISKKRDDATSLLSSMTVGMAIPGAVTLGDTENSDPVAGTIEFSDTHFRWYNGTEWVVMMSGDIGSSVIQGAVAPVVSDTFLGNSDASVIQARGSAILTSQASTLNVDQSWVDQVQSSTVLGQDLRIGALANSTVNGSKNTVDFTADSQIIGDNNTVAHTVTSHMVGHGNHVVRGTRLNANSQSSRWASVVDTQGRVAQSTIDTVQDAHVMGTALSLDRVMHSVVSGNHSTVEWSGDGQIYGDNNRVVKTTGVRILGDNNGVLMGKNNRVHGHNNQLIHANDAVIHGNSQRILGHHARVEGHGNTVIGDKVNIHGHKNVVMNASDDPVTVTGDGRVVFQVNQGVHIVTGDDLVVSATAASGGWAMVSDKTLKDRFSDVDDAAVFNALMGVPVSAWSYVFNPEVVHMGPMAQDVYAAFNIGTDERFIVASDADGVAFSSLKYLIQVTDALADPSSFNHATPRTHSLDDLLLESQWVADRIAFFERSLKIKSNALASMAEASMAQYEHIDRQMKAVAPYHSQMPMRALLKSLAGGMGGLILGIIVGFYGLKRYDKIKNKSGRNHGV